MIVYETRKLVKCYPGQKDAANGGIDLQIREGEIFGLLGGNGAGKSTFVRQLVNLVRPTSGQILLFGVPIDVDPLRVPLHVGYMPQNASALGSLTVAQALYFTAHLRGKSRAAAREERERLLDFWDLRRLRNRAIAHLSGGQKRLACLATATAATPPVLILDEPTNDLDPGRRHQVWERLRALRSNHGTTVVLVTHDAVEAERVIDRVGILRDGKLVTIGQPFVLKRELDRRVRLEMSFPPGRPPVVPAGIAVHELGPGRWVLQLDRSRIAEVLDCCIDMTDLDFRLHSATLEDVYLHYANA